MMRIRDPKMKKSDQQTRPKTLLWTYRLKWPTIKWLILYDSYTFRFHPTLNSSTQTEKGSTDHKIGTKNHRFKTYRNKGFGPKPIDPGPGPAKNLGPYQDQQEISNFGPDQIRTTTNFQTSDRTGNNKILLISDQFGLVRGSQVICTRVISQVTW